MSKKKNISRDTLERWISQWANLKPQPPQSYSMKDMFQAAYDAIAGLIEKNYTLEIVQRSLEKEGIKLSLASIKRYWSEAQAGRITDNNPNQDGVEDSAAALKSNNNRRTRRRKKD